MNIIKTSNRIQRVRMGGNALAKTQAYINKLNEELGIDINIFKDNTYEIDFKKLNEIVK